MDSDPTDRRRALMTALLWVVGLLLVVLGLVASWWILAQRELAIERERTRLQTQIEDVVAQWERGLLFDLQNRLEVASRVPVPNEQQTEQQMEQLQRKWRRQVRWFDSVFLWVPPHSRQQAVPLFPVMSVPDENQQLVRSPCLNYARDLQIRMAPIEQVIAAWLVGCRHERENVRLTASVNAAYMLWGLQKYEQALLALEAAGIPENLTLRMGAQQGVSPFRLTTWQTMRAKALEQIGRPDEAAALALRVGEQITELEAPDLGSLSLHMPELLTILKRTGHVDEAQALEERFDRVIRRKRAYEEVLNKLTIEQVNPNDPPPPRFVHDVYSDQPFLLYYGWSNGYGVGIALEQAPLIEDFLRNRVRGLSDAITLVEARSGSWVAGARSGGRCAIEVPFTETLTHLRLCVRESALIAATASLHKQWLVPISFIVVCVSIGVAALVALGRATSHEYELINRQRAFSTRVTHELKTPLAGIRVMAENLELGAFRDEEHRKEMAHRIVVEADQLKRRVDEVLAVARQRTIPSPEPFDPEEVLLLAVEEWGPRFADAGVDFQADLAPTDTVLGDGNALKDAVACLLDNALKYRREDRQPIVKLELVQIGRQVQITVTDNGLGVPKAMRKRIFDRFVRVEGPNRGKAGGHGLGLHQVREIVTAHHGTVTCGEGIDGGAQFIIRLPVKKR